MNYRRFAAYSAALACAGLPLLALAANSGSPSGVLFQNPISANTIPQLLGMLLKFAVRVATVIAVVYLIWSGFLFVKAQGKPEEIERAKRAFFFAVIGTMLMLGAEVIAQAISKTVQDIS